MFFLIFISCFIGMSYIYENIGIMIPDVLLPKKSLDLPKWAVVACDQYTSEPEYREKVAGIVQEDPSTLHIVYPEVYLEDTDKGERIQKIQKNMQRYLAQGIFENHEQCLILVDRKTTHAVSRKGLILALDLEKYDYTKGSQTLIRATEGTVVDRLPPRIQIRQGASIESPHIMVLIDDEAQTVIEPLFENLAKYEEVYDFEMMMDGGHIKGYKVADQASIDQVVQALTKLAHPGTFGIKYGVGAEKGVLLFAMGDGNHSLATAKAIWEAKKKSLTPEEFHQHPSRFALVEIVNVHDAGLKFEPIHRVLFHISENFLEEMQKFFENIGSSIVLEYFQSKDEMQAKMHSSDASTHYITFVSPTGYGEIGIRNPKLNLEVGNLQAFLDAYLNTHPQSKIDYVHGADVTERLGSQT